MSIPDDTSKIDALLAVMAQLRNPDGGCPWDLEQNFRTIAPHTLEEAYEVTDAIERGDMDDLQEELGDLLLQVVFHAQMASEEAHFDFADVVEGIVTKLIRRHPHVFGNEIRNSAGEVLTRWDEIKAEEKAQKLKARQDAPGSRLDPPASRLDPPASRLDEVPGNLPGLLQAMKLQKKAAKAGFDWPDASGAKQKVEEELGELQAGVKKGDADEVEAELGDLLFSCVNLARHLKVDPDAALRRTNLKFRTRFALMEKAAGGADLADLPLDKLESLWQQAKIKI